MENCKTIKANRELLKNAIKGMSISYDVLGKACLPENIINPSNNGEPRVNPNRLDKYSAEELYAIYQLLSGDERALSLYDGFTGKCQAEMDFEKERDRYVESIRNNQEVYTQADEIRDLIDFNILHDLKSNAMSGVMTVKQMEAESEKVRERKFDEVVKTVCSKLNGGTVSVSKVDGEEDLVGKDYARIDHNGTSVLLYNTDAVYMKLTDWKASNDAVYRITIGE